MNPQQVYEEWLLSPIFDEQTKEELKKIKGDEKEIEDRFYRELEFGTGGLRGILGAGTNRMNAYTVAKATQGLANFIIEEKGQERGVVIAYDSRHRSREFAISTGCCFAANGIKAYVFEELRPTPELSFAVRELNCIAGVVITASHNPPEYNGYKVYWEDGAQITPPKDSQIIAQVHQVTDYASILMMNEKEAIQSGRLEMIGSKIDDRYIEELKKLVENQEAINKAGQELKIVYTPLHGTGNYPVTRILRELGFKQVYMVKEQEQPDSRFPTVEYPNPEDEKAFTMALDLAKEVDADIVLATDPDADRLGVYAKDGESGQYHPFTGNMSGMLICEYLLSQKKAKGTLPKNGALIKTIVTTDMANKAAESYNIKLIETLTGFKYIGEQIKFFDENQKYEYLFGFEESYGCLVGTHARDKDAVVAVMTLCEAAAYYKTKGKTLCDRMIDIYNKYGYYKEELRTITLKGKEGKEQIQSIITKLREHPPTEISDYKVLEYRDYKTGIIKHMSDGRCEPTHLQKSNVLYYKLEQEAWFCVRPSGTEPKIKFYYGVRGESLEGAKKKLIGFAKYIECIY